MKGFNNHVKIWKETNYIANHIKKHVWYSWETHTTLREEKHWEKMFWAIVKRKESLFLDLKGLESIWKREHWTRERMDLKEDKKKFELPFFCN